MRFGAMEGILPRSAPEGLADADEAGFVGVELDVGGPDPADDPFWNARERDRIRREAADRGLALPSVCLGFLNGGGLTSDDADVRGDARDALVRAADGAAALGADTILVPFFGPAEIQSDEHRGRVVAGMERVADSAAAAGVTFALEATLPVSDFCDLVDEIDHPNVGVYYDTGNCLRWDEDPAAAIRELGDRMAQLHFKDMSDAGSEMMGEGDVDFDDVVAALDEVGYDDWVVLETAAEGDAAESAAENLRYSRSVV